MTVREVITPANPILRQKARKVTQFNTDLHTLIDDMVETMLDAPGVGLAAPQIGILQRIIVVRLPDDEEAREEFGDEAGKLYEVVNPEIIKNSRDVVEGVEACLSIPGYFGRVDRADHIVIRGQDRTGEDFRIKAYGWLARVFQHEIDHLDGILYIDRATEVWKAGEEPAPQVRTKSDEANSA